MLRYTWYYECDECGEETQKEDVYDYGEGYEVLKPSPKPNYKWNYVNGLLYCPQHNVTIEDD